MIILPSRRLLGLLLAWTTLGLVVSVWPRLLPIWRMGGWVLLAMVLLEVLLLVFPKPFTVERECSPSLAIGAWKAVKVRIHSHSKLPWSCTVMDHHPADFRARGQGQQHWIPAEGFLELTYHLRPIARGRRTFGPVQVRVEGPLGMVARDLRLPCEAGVKVFPDFATLARYALLATDNRLSTLGILRRPRRGEGLDFHQLREYRTGDSLRRIDWKATARARKLISREYQDERDQQVFFLLDCGRRMRALDEADGRILGHFDQALNALFLLSYVALKQGDAVGVATCALDEDRLLAPRKGLGALDHLFHQLFDLEPSLHATDHLAAAQSLHQRLKRRSLVVILTNLRDEEDETLAPALALLRSRHLVLVANLRETIVDKILERTPKSFEDSLLQSSAFTWHQARQHSILTLRHHGAQVLDVTPEALPIALVNRYLEMKASGVF